MAKKQRLSHKKQHRSVSSNPVGRPKAVKAINNEPPKLTREIIAQMLWHDDYYPLLTNFMDRHPQLRDLVLAYLKGSESTYRHRLDGEALELYLRRINFKVSQAMSIVTTLGHQVKGQDVPKVLVSLLALLERTSDNDWDRDVKAGKLTSKAVAQDWLRLMRKYRPQPSFPITNQIGEVCSDQLLLYRGCRKGRTHRATEVVDKVTGKKVKVDSCTIMNMQVYPHDYTKYENFDQHMLDIEKNGVWTESPREVLKFLDLYVAEEELHENFDLQIQMVHQQNNVDLNDVRSVYILSARPNYNPNGPTVVQTQIPLPNCDTNNHNGIQKHTNFILAELFPEAKFVISRGDGQYCANVCTASNTRVERYENIIWVPESMHGEGHIAVFAVFIIWTPCMIGPLKEELEFKKIEDHPFKFDDDRLDNHKYFLIALTLAATFVLRARHPQAIADSKRMERACEFSVGDKILYQFLLQAGFPELRWQQSTRANKGASLDKSWKWVFFMGMAAHKTGYNQYSVHRAHATKCSHPLIRQILQEGHTQSPTGKIGCNAAKDDRVEDLQRRCQKYNKHPEFALEDAFFYAKYSDELEHVKSTYNKMLDMELDTRIDNKPGELIDCFFATHCDLLHCCDLGFYNNVDQMVIWFQHKLHSQPNDQTNTHNPFNGHKLPPNFDRFEKPWELPRKVALGEVGPVGHPFAKKHYKTWMKGYMRQSMHMDFESDSD